jgi:hypothetical protein
MLRAPAFVVPTLTRDGPLAATPGHEIPTSRLYGPRIATRHPRRMSSRFIVGAMASAGAAGDWIRVSFYREPYLRRLPGIPTGIRPVAWLCLGPVTHLETVPDLERHGWRHRCPLWRPRSTTTTGEHPAGHQNCSSDPGSFQRAAGPTARSGLRRARLLLRTDMHHYVADARCRRGR